jgi:hypothetical protein
MAAFAYPTDTTWLTDQTSMTTNCPNGWVTISASCLSKEDQEDLKQAADEQKVQFRKEARKKNRQWVSVKCDLPFHLRKWYR